MSIASGPPAGQGQKPPLRVVTEDSNTPQHTWPVAYAVTLRNDMKLIDKMALLVMLSYANVALGWKVWASEKAIFARMGCDQKAGRKAISRLEAAGILRVARQKTQNAPNNYFVDPVAAAHASVHPDPEHPKADHPKTDAPVDPHRDHPVDPKTDAPVHPKADHEHTTPNIRSEQTTENKRGMSTSMSMPAGSTPTASRVASTAGPVLNKRQAAKIVEDLPKRLMEYLELVTDNHRGFGAGYFRKHLIDHIRFRGPGEWTQICWYVLWRYLQTSDGWDPIQDPAVYTATVADHPEYREDLVPYSDATVQAEVNAHNERNKSCPK